MENLNWILIFFIVVIVGAPLLSVIADTSTGVAANPNITSVGTAMVNLMPLWFSIAILAIMLFIAYKANWFGLGDAFK